jgi:predicted nucleic-acid-binding protein
MRAVDTNVLVRLLARDDPSQVAAAEAFVLPGAWISHLVLMEAVWVLDTVYSVTPAQIANGVDMLLDHAHMVVQDADVVKAAVAQYRKHPRLGFSDCLILEVARAAGHVPLGTFDRGLGKLQGAQKLG